MVVMMRTMNGDDNDDDDSHDDDEDADDVDNMSEILTTKSKFMQAQDLTLL